MLYKHEIYIVLEVKIYVTQIKNNLYFGEGTAKFVKYVTNSK